MVTKIHNKHQRSSIYKGILIFLAAIVTAFFSSCSTEDDFDYNNNTISNISLSPNINETKNRVLGTEFENGDKIGVYVVEYTNNNNTPGTIGYGNYAENVAHIFNGKDWIPENGKKLPWLDKDTKVDIYSYYPFSSEIGDLYGSALEKVPFRIKPDQSTKANYEASDFLWAKSEPTLPTTNRINLPFTHQMSKIKINMKSLNGFTPEELSNAILQIYNTIQSGTIDMRTGEVTAESNVENAISPLLATTPTAGYDATFELIIIPQTIANGTDLISIRSYENSSPYIYTTKESLEFLPQKERAFNITISRSGISVSVGAIQDWESTPAQDGDLGQIAPKIVDLRKIDWDKSHVYKVMDKGVQIAEINREFVYKTGTINRQAIVAYPMGSDGKADITKGFVAQVMQASINNTIEKYDVDQSNIHGGTASWNVVQNSLDSYTAGSLAPIEKIQIDGANISAAKASSIDFLTVEADLLTDIRGDETNTYGLVKIGSQYWMRENLRAEKYRDGTELEYFYYNNDAATYKYTYGGLYTWDTAMNEKGLAPTGWHIPSDDDFRFMHSYLAPDAGRKLKSLKPWNNPANSSNITGFYGLPSGRRIPNGTFNEALNYGQWWTSTKASATDGSRLYLDSGNAAMHLATLPVNYTQSIRCVKD